jgi:hypothetical protein
MAIVLDGSVYCCNLRRISVCIHLRLSPSDIFQAYIMELEAEVAKLKENNEELQKKQVYLKLLW